MSLPKISAKVRSAIMLGLLAAIFSIEFYQRSNLADRIPIVFTILGAALGTLLGSWTATRIYSQQPNGRSLRQTLGIFAIPIFCLFAGTYVARSIYVGAAFAGVEATPIEGKLSVESRETGGKRWLGKRRVNVVLDGGSREFRVLVTENLYSAIGPNPAIGAHCLMLAVEEGRWGTRRVSAPNYFDNPLGLEHYALC